MNEEQQPIIEPNEARATEGGELPQGTKWENDDPEVKTKKDFEIRRGRIDDTWEIQKEGIDTSTHPLFSVSRDALGLSRNSAINQHQEMEEVINLAVQTLKSDDPTEVFNYLSRQIRHTNGKSMRAILQRLKTVQAELS